MDLLSLLFSPLSDASKKPAQEERVHEASEESATPESLIQSTIDRKKETRAEATRVINETVDLLENSEVDLDLEALFIYEGDEDEAA